VTEATAMRENGSALMGQGLASLVNLLHREPKDTFQHQTVPQNDSQIAALVVNTTDVAAALINSSEIAALIDSTGSQELSKQLNAESDLLDAERPQELSHQAKEDVVSVDGQPRQDDVLLLDAAWLEEQRSNNSLNSRQDPNISISLKVTSEDHDTRTSVPDSKGVQVHAASDANADAVLPSSHMELSSSVASTASNRKQVVRSQSPTQLQTDASQKKREPRNFFWFHWELVRLAKSGLLILGILVTIGLSLALVMNKMNKSAALSAEKQESSKNQRLLAVANRLHGASEDRVRAQREAVQRLGLKAEPQEKQAAAGSCEQQIKEVPQIPPAQEMAENKHSTSDSSLTDRTSEKHAMHLMEELGFSVPSTEDILLPTAKARDSSEEDTGKATSSHLCPEMALSQETRDRRTAMMDILRNLPDVKDRGPF